jgi:hypothetical protein
MTPAKQIQFVKDKLAANPALTLNHFHRHCGFSRPMLVKLRESGEVTFGEQRSKTGGWK